MNTITDKVAAITGAASGIGRATAVLFAQRGCHLALSDVDEQGLEQTAESCRGHVQVHTARVDVAQREAVHAWADSVQAHFGRVNIAINNAGVALGATISEMTYEDLEWLMGINFWGVVHGTKAFLPHLKASGDGHLVNLSSLFGLLAMPSQGAYNAAKFAVRGFTEALRMELELEGAPVGVTSVHPGGVRTNIAKSSRRRGAISEAAAKRFERALVTPPEVAAQDILTAILEDRPRQLVGRDARILDLLQRLMPVRYQRLMVDRARKLSGLPPAEP